MDSPLQSTGLRNSGMVLSEKLSVEQRNVVPNRGSVYTKPLLPSSQTNCCALDGMTTDLHIWQPGEVIKARTAVAGEANPKN